LNFKVIFLGGAKFEESKTMPVSWCNLCYTNENQEKYNNIIREVAERNNCIFIDIFDMIDGNDLSNDGLHYNSQGHKKIFELVKRSLINKN
jgi:lysophospholipase L1-like esterase